MHRIVGLDVTPESLRMVALESGFRGFRVLEAKSAQLSGEGSLSERLKGALAQLGLSLGDDSVAVALPSSQVASHLFTLPFTDPRRIEQVLPAEVEGAIPFEMDEVIWDHCVLSQEGGKSRVLVAVAQKSVLENTLAELKAAGIDPRCVTCAPMALAALQEKKLLAPIPELAPEADGAVRVAGSVLLLEAGPERASATLLYAGSIELARSLSAAPVAMWSAAEAGEEGALERLLLPLVRDLKLALRARAIIGPKAPTRALLLGPLAALPGAASRLSALLELEAAPLALGAHVELPAGSLHPSEFGLALALSLRAQSPRGHVNFRKGPLAFTKDLSQARGQLARLVTAAAVVLILALASGIASVASLSRKATAYDDALCAATKKVLGNCLTDYRMAVSQMSGSGSKAGGIPRASASEILAEVMAHLPEAAIPLLDDVEITTNSIRIKGVAESYGAVDQIVAALKADKCMGDIKQPRVEKQRDSSKIVFALDFPYSCSGEAGGA